MRKRHRLQFSGFPVFINGIYTPHIFAKLRFFILLLIVTSSIRCNGRDNFFDCNYEVLIKALLTEKHHTGNSKLMETRIVILVRSILDAGGYLPDRSFLLENKKVKRIVFQQRAKINQ